MNLKWFCNDYSTYDSSSKRWKSEDDWQRWRSRFVVGAPKSPEGSVLSVDRLKAMNLVGLYERVE